MAKWKLIEEFDGIKTYARKVHGGALVMVRDKVSIGIAFVKNGGPIYDDTSIPISTPATKAAPKKRTSSSKKK